MSHTGDAGQGERLAQVRRAGEDLELGWATDPRWRGIRRDYSGGDVVGLRGSFPVDGALARAGAERLWELLHTTDYVAA